MDKISVTLTNDGEFWRTTVNRNGNQRIVYLGSSKKIATERWSETAHLMVFLLDRPFTFEGSNRIELV